MPNHAGLENIPGNIIMKTTDSPAQSQPNPRKNRLKVVFRPIFPTANDFSFGWDWFCTGSTDCKKPTKPNQILRKHPTFFSPWK